jgi:AcrR family transcriptional regulator
MSEIISTRQRILAAAQELFTRQGYHGTSTRKLANLAGITEGAIFRHFASKREILISLLTPKIPQELEAKSASLPQGSPKEVLSQFTQMRIQQFSSLFPLLKIVLLESEVDPELKATWLKQVLLQARELLEKRFDHWQASGEVRKDLNPEALAQLYMTQLFGALFLNQVSEGIFFSPQTLASHMEISLELFLNSVTT